MDLSELIRIDYAPSFTLDRDAAALNVVGASASASRSSLPAGTYKYIAPLTGSDAASGDIGAPWKTITKHNLSGGSNIGIITEAGTITLGTGAETDKAITRSLQAAVGIAPPVIALSGAWTPAANADGLSNDPVCLGHNGAKILVASNTGELRQSTNGTSWSDVTEAASTFADFIVYGPGVWIVGGAGGDLASSADGSTFTARTVATGWSTSNCSAADYGPLGFLVGSSDGKFQTSTNGVSWSLLTTPDEWGTKSCVSIRYGAGKYVCVSASVDGTAAKVIVASTSDLESWTFSNYIYTTTVVVGAQGQTALAYGGGVWSLVIGEKFFYSSDAVSWTETPAPANLSPANPGWLGVAYGGGHFVAYGVRTYAYSTNAVDWTTFASSHGSLYAARSAIYGPAGWVAVGSGVANGVETWAGAVRISASVCGLAFETVGASFAGASAAATVQNCDFDLGLDVLPGSYTLALKNSKLASLRARLNNFSDVCENVVLGEVELDRAFNASSSFDRNTIAGRLYDRQTTVYALSSFKDNILDGGLDTNRTLAVNGGNVRGGVIGATLSDSVSSFAPLFIDQAGGDFRLRRKSDGFAFASRLSEASENYAPNGAAGTGRDLGAYSFDYSAEVEEFESTLWLPRPDVGNVKRIIGISASFDPVLEGEPIGAIDPSAHFEEIALAFEDVDADAWAGLKALLAQTEARVRLTWTPDDAAAGSVTTNGAATAGDPTITIDATNIGGASAISIAGSTYRILRASPSRGAATRLVLASDLADNVAGGETLELVGSPGTGVYVVRFPERFEASPDLSTVGEDDLSGVVLSFARALT